MENDDFELFYKLKDEYFETKLILNGWYNKLYEAYYDRRIINEEKMDAVFFSIVTRDKEKELSEKDLKLKITILKTIAYTIETICNSSDHIWRSYKRLLDIMEKPDEEKSTFEYLIERIKDSDKNENYDKLMMYCNQLSKEYNFKFEDSLLNELYEDIQKYLTRNNKTVAYSENIEKVYNELQVLNSKFKVYMRK